MKLPEKKIEGLTICMTDVDGLTVGLGVDIDISDWYDEGYYPEEPMNPETRYRYFTKSELMDEDTNVEILEKAISELRTKLSAAKAK